MTSWPRALRSAPLACDRLDHETVYMVGAGIASPVGRSLVASATAVRAGLSGYAEHPFMLDQQCEPMNVARAPWLAAELPLAERLVALGRDATRDAMHAFTDGALLPHGFAIHVAIALPTDAMPRTAAEDAANTIARSGLTRSDAARVTAVTLVAGAAPAAVRAFAVVRDELLAGRCELALVVGVDSWLVPERLEALDRSGQLHSPTMPWGFTPGEGAGTCVLARGDTIRLRGWDAGAAIEKVACAVEPNPVGSGRVCLGDGVTAVVGAVVNPDRPIGRIVCDLNGEPVRAEEWGFASMRMREGFVDVTRFIAPACAWGDVGTASAPMLAALALAEWHLSDDAVERTLVWTSGGHDPQRGALVLARDAHVVASTGDNAR
ncbi:MAG: hypothetical protein MUE41_06735 [Gemmatimonadaceae bacterium]|jgi:3-oxoacyl-[acyl-carrier-protein] synthase-1|nr:hypothetical protein [Gemmatimonadaceae bacterium]